MFMNLNVLNLLLYQKNNTYFGISAVHTGQDDISKVQQFTMWRHES